MSNKLFGVLLRLDDLCAELEDISNMLGLYDENLTDDFKPLREGENWGGEHIKGRWPLHLSTLNVIRLRLYDILDGMQKNVSQGLCALRENEIEHT